jgi:hypothetical protein
MKLRIESEDRDLVLARAELRQHRVERLARHRQLRRHAHAAAHVYENGQTDGRAQIRADGQDLPELTVVADLEVFGRQAVQRAPPIVPH